MNPQTKIYTCIIADESEPDILTLLSYVPGNLLKEKAIQTFIRLHRSYAIQKRFIKQISAKEVMVSDMLLPVGRNYKKTVKKLLTQ
jgi:two-component system LytT family response regulator